MKKRLGFMFLATILITALLVSCGGQEEGVMTDGDTDVAESEGELQDGTYLVKYPVEHGNFSMATMEVVDGEISSFHYAEIIADSGEEKNEENYSNYIQVLPIIEDLNKQFNEKKDLSEIDFDAITGATGTVESFKAAVNDLLEKAKAGDIYSPVYADGIYTAKAEEDSRGWLGEVTVVVRNGQIVGIDYYEAAIEDMESSRLVFDEYGEPIEDEEGKLKTEPVEVKKGERKSAENYSYLELFEVIEEVRNLVIDNNGIRDMDVDAVTGATGSRDTMVELIEKALEDAKI